jgi:hypothetical protein
VTSQPSCVSVRDHSRRSGSVTAARIWRSKKFSRLMAKSRYRVSMRFCAITGSSKSSTRRAQREQSAQRIAFSETKKFSASSALRFFHTP